MFVKLLNEQLLEFLGLKRGCAGSPESTLVKMPHCWKSRVAAQIEKVKNEVKDSVIVRLFFLFTFTALFQQRHE